MKSGTVKEYEISKKGEELIVNIFKPKSFFPMSWAINDTSNLYFFEAMSDLEVWRSPKSEVIEFVKSNPDVLYDLLGRVYRGVDGLLNKMTYLMSGNAYARLVTELVIQARRFGIRTGNKIEMEISEKDIASQTGMTRETISREIRNLKSKKLVDFGRNNLQIFDIDRLTSELNEGF